LPRRNQESKATTVPLTTNTNTLVPNVRKGGIAEIGFLNYGENNNLQDFKRKLSIYSFRQFKILGHMIELEEYFVPPDISDPNPNAFDQYNDPLGGLRVIYIERLMRGGEKVIYEMQSNRTALYSVIWGQLSSESDEKVI